MKQKNGCNEVVNVLFNFLYDSVFTVNAMGTMSILNNISVRSITFKAGCTAIPAFSKMQQLSGYILLMIDKSYENFPNHGLFVQKWTKNSAYFPEGFNFSRHSSNGKCIKFPTNDHNVRTYHKLSQTSLLSAMIITTIEISPNRAMAKLVFSRLVSDEREKMEG